MKVFLYILLNFFSASDESIKIDSFDVDNMLVADSIEVLIPSFHGNAERNWGGYGSISSLNTIWKFDLREGTLVISR